MQRGAVGAFGLQIDLHLVRFQQRLDRLLVAGVAGVVKWHVPEVVEDVGVRTDGQQRLDGVVVGAAARDHERGVAAA